MLRGLDESLSDAKADIDGFGVYIESWPVGVHQLPHVFMGGTNADVPSAASDPWFPCHHAALDFIWILWQSIDLDNRTLALGKAESYADLRKRSQGKSACPDVKKYAAMADSAQRRQRRALA